MEPREFIVDTYEKYEEFVALIRNSRLVRENSCTPFENFMESVNFAHTYGIGDPDKRYLIWDMRSIYFRTISEMNRDRRIKEGLDVYVATLYSA